MLWILCILLYGFIFCCLWIVGYDDYQYNKKQQQKTHTISESKQIKQYQDLYDSWSK
jgi:hypothetical protein